MEKNKKLKAVRITITYDGVGLTLKQAIKDVWNVISNDRDFQNANINKKEIDIEETSFDPSYLKELEDNNETQ